MLVHLCWRVLAKQVIRKYRIIAILLNLIYRVALITSIVVYDSKIDSYVRISHEMIELILDFTKIIGTNFSINTTQEILTL